MPRSHCSGSMVTPTTLSRSSRSQLTTTLRQRRPCLLGEISSGIYIFFQNLPYFQQNYLNLFFFRWQYLKPVIFISGFVLVRHLTGGTVIMTFMSQIFREAHTSIDVKYCVIILGTFQLVFVSLSGLLMDKIGRRKCIYISATIMGIAQAAVGAYSYLEEHPDYKYLTEK